MDTVVKCFDSLMISNGMSISFLELHIGQETLIDWTILGTFCEILNLFSSYILNYFV